MGPRPTTIYVCQECGGQSPKWLGRCPECGSWDGLVEESPSPSRLSSLGAEIRVPDPVLLGELPEQDAQRWQTGISVLDRVLGGGLVSGSTILLAGEPGIGLLQPRAHESGVIEELLRTVPVP